MHGIRLIQTITRRLLSALFGAIHKLPLFDGANLAIYNSVQPESTHYSMELANGMH